MYFYDKNIILYTIHNYIIKISLMTLQGLNIEKKRTYRVYPTMRCCRIKNVQLLTNVYGV